MSRRLIWAGLAVMALCASSAPARAGFVRARFDGASPGQGVTLKLGGNTVSTSAGQHAWTVLSQPTNPDPLFYGPSNHAPGGQFVTFCVELTQSISVGGSYTYEVVALSQVPQPGGGSGNPSSGMGEQKAAYVRELFGRFHDQIAQAATAADRDTRAAAFQTAVWEIVHDGPPGTWSLAGGNFALSNPGSAAAQLAQSWLNDVQANGAADVSAFTSRYANYQLYGLRSTAPLGSAQDQVVLLSVPAPPALVLAGLGGLSLLSAGLLRRRARPAVLS